MKKNLSITIFLFLSSYCFAQQQDSLIETIKKLKSDWVDSWVEYPFEDMETSPKQELDLTNYNENNCDTLSDQEPFYTYSPNGKQVVDVYSVTFYIGENEQGEKTICAADPDVGVFLFDLENKKTYRTLYFGTGATYDDVLWLSDTSFVILTSYQLQPLLIEIDIKNKTNVFHIYKKNMPKFNYVERKFLKLGFKADC